MVISVPDVWAAWTEPGQLARWWGPKGYTNPVCHIDPRPQGSIHIVMRAPDGSEYDNRGTVQSADPPRSLVFTIELKNPDQSTRLVNLTTVELAEDGDGTLLRVRVRVLHETADAAPDIAGMHAGWPQSLDRLAVNAARPLTDAVRLRQETGALSAPAAGGFEGWPSSRPSVAVVSPRLQVVRPRFAAGAPRRTGHADR